MESSIEVAQHFYPRSKYDRRARTIRKWANHYLHFHELPSIIQGQHQKTPSIVDNEDIIEAFLYHLRLMNANGIGGRSFAEWVNSELVNRVNDENLKSINISMRTATRWLHFLGFSQCHQRQGMYIDGHERADVVEYRKRILERMSNYQKRMFVYSGDNCEIIQLPCQE